VSNRALNALTAGVIVALLAVVVTSLLGGKTTTEDRAYALEERLRCPVCKSVSIAESPSETAASMRRVVAEQIAAGRSDAEIVDYFKDRYGQWVLLDPPMSGVTKWLWLLSLGAGGVGVGVLLLRARTKHPESTTLTEADREQVAVAMDLHQTRDNEDDEP
jgi:cytochrome c-type biogenesis protein CcmH